MYSEQEYLHPEKTFIDSHYKARRYLTRWLKMAV
jgi:hypothetical protein